MSGPVARMVYRRRNQREEMNEPVISVGNFAPRGLGLRPSTTATARRGGGSRAGIADQYDNRLRRNIRRQLRPEHHPAQCPNIRVAPVLTIRSGVARFAAFNLTFQGYATPQGALMMQSEGGQTFEGKIDPYFVLKGRVTGNCIYDATWTKHQSPRV
jgi:hypothetical protein